MLKGPNEEQARPLPPEWLPEPTPLEGTGEWEVARARLMAALGARSEECAAARSGGGSEERVARPAVLGARSEEREAAWSAVLGSWWKRAAVLAAAAVALAVMLDPPPSARPSAAADPGALPLRLLAAGGDPAALMDELGIPADPVLALVASTGGDR